MVVKIDNTEAQPQLGLGKADLITEELVEGGSTRLAVFYYQHSRRSSDRCARCAPPTSAS